MDERPKILIVDDNLLNAKILENLLKKDYQIKTARSGEETLDIIEAINPDMLLLDILMDGIDGYEVCKKIRANSKLRLIKIILISGKTSVEERLEGYDAGADDYITKPFVAEELEAKIRVFMRLKRAEEVNNIKSDLINLFSHETRTPLNSIIGFAELLLKSKNLQGKPKQFAERVYHNAIRLGEFIEKSMLLGNLKMGMKLEKNPENVEKHVSAIAHSFREKATDKNITIDIAAQENIKLNADWQMMQKVFSFLFDNAIKFSPENENVGVIIQKHDRNCIIKIQNQGKIISPDWINKIFDEFAIRDIMHHQKGQGISLAIARHIVEHHDGTIRVESSEENGTIFYIKIPL